MHNKFCPMSVKEALKIAPEWFIYSPDMGILHRKKFGRPNHPRWAIAVASLIHNEGQSRFRWFDPWEGLTKARHYRGVVEIAKLLPHITFWLPTQVDKFAKETWPANLVVHPRRVY